MKIIHYFIVGISALGLVACENEAATNLAAAAVGAGIGMAVSNDDDKEQGALLGAGLGALLANELQKQNQTQVQTTKSTPEQTAVSNPEDLNPVIAAHNSAVQMALESGSPEKWRSGKSSGTIYPKESFTEYGLTCKGYDSLYKSGTESGTVSGRACRQPNGFWKDI